MNSCNQISRGACVGLLLLVAAGCAQEPGAEAGATAVPSNSEEVELDAIPTQDAADAFAEETIDESNADEVYDQLLRDIDDG